MSTSTRSVTPANATVTNINTLSNTNAMVTNTNAVNHTKSTREKESEKERFDREE